MSDLKQLSELVALLREAARRVENIVPLVSEAEATRVCNLLEPSIHELGARLDEVQQGDWIEPHPKL